MSFETKKIDYLQAKKQIEAMANHAVKTELLALSAAQALEPFIGAMFHKGTVDKLQAEGVSLSLVQDYSNAWELRVRYSEWSLRHDYHDITGDLELRLKVRKGKEPVSRVSKEHVGWFVDKAKQNVEHRLALEAKLCTLEGAVARWNEHLDGMRRVSETMDRAVEFGIERLWPMSKIFSV